jgi:RNA polymerase sigma-70 factor (ECF subfamily)
MTMEQAIRAEDIRDEAGSDFESVATTHRGRVVRFIFASVRNRETAENLTQECFIRAYKAWERFRGDANAGTWLMGIAANLIRTHEASQRLKFWRRALNDSEGVLEWVPDGQTSPEELAAAREQVAAIWKAAARLPERQRTVFLLRFVEDMKLLEISAVTGMKEGTVKTHLFRALKTVRSALEEKS